MEDTLNCELCIVGTGLAGINALHVASSYLKPTDKVLVFDQKEGVGGIWNSTYDHVRLHQPHRLFTAGDIPWKLQKEASHLADKQEVLAQFRHCWQVLESKLNVEGHFGYRYISHEEVPSDNEGHEVHVAFAAVKDDKPDLRVKTKRLIKATGYNVKPNAPFQVDHALVNSIAPESPEFLSEKMDADDKPIYVIGGGKTGTDAAYHAIQKYPGRKIEMLVGGGTGFFKREMFFPEGTRRLYGGTLVLEALADIAMRYDGNNEQEAFDYFLKNYGLALDGKATRCFFGLLSASELEVLRNGLHATRNEYLETVEEMDGQVFMHLRDGKKLPIEKGSWIVNCTGHLLREDTPHEPYLSEHGAILSVQQTDAPFFVTSFGAYFLTHLFFLDKLCNSNIYCFNHEVLHSNRPEVYMIACAAQLVHNVLVLVDELPFHVIKNCGINFDNWYPLYRVLFLVGSLKVKQGKYLNHFKTVLDCVDEKYQIRGNIPEAVAA